MNIIYHTTEDEIDFIRNLGKHSEAVCSPRVFLIRQYLKGCRSKIKWGNTNKDIIIRFAEQQLNEEISKI